MSEFGWPVRVYHEDVDTMGVVYYANYLKFYERARTEYLRAIGFDQDQLMVDHGIMFVVRSVQIDYLKPAHFNELLWISAKISTLTRSSFQFDQQTCINDKNGECLNQATVKVVCVDTTKVRPSPIPKEILESFQHS